MASASATNICRAIDPNPDMRTSFPARLQAEGVSGPKNIDSPGNEQAGSRENVARAVICLLQEFSFLALD
jgi:hypothetical protein